MVPVKYSVKSGSVRQMQLQFMVFIASMTTQADRAKTLGSNQGQKQVIYRQGIKDNIRIRNAKNKAKARTK